MPGHLPDRSVRDVTCGDWKRANGSAARTTVFRVAYLCVIFCKSRAIFFGRTWKRRVFRSSRVRAAQATRPVAHREFQGSSSENSGSGGVIARGGPLSGHHHSFRWVAGRATKVVCPSVLFLEIAVLCNEILDSRSEGCTATQGS